MTDNAPLPPPPLPAAGPAAGWQPLPVRAVRVAALSAALSMLVPFAAFAVFATLADPGTPPVYLGIGALGTAMTAGWAWLSARRARRTRWRLDGHALGLRRERLWTSDVRVPRARVQHLDVQRGPLQRRFGLATLVVHTAGSQHQALRIQGLAVDDAERLRELLARPDDHDGL